MSAGLILGTFVSYQDSFDENGRFILPFFLFMEALVVTIIAVLFYIYSRKKS
ncbi:MAG TPA: hypothetical protein VJ180_05305 [Pyrinomonadaceae bacterium]|nr:hypothetical protein [Pyrinomonadaceae bacterium]